MLKKLFFKLRKDVVEQDKKMPMLSRRKNKQYTNCLLFIKYMKAPLRQLIP